MATQTMNLQDASGKVSNSDIERIYREWDAALSNNDMEALLKLYAPDAILESPLVSHLLGREEGVCRGQDELKSLFNILAARKPEVRKFSRSGYLTNGRTVM